MRKILLLSLLVFAATVFSQAPVKKLSEREKKILEINRELDKSTIMELLRKCNNDIMKSIKDKKPLEYIKYYSFAAGVDSSVKYRWFIADPGLSRKWLKGVRDLLSYMGKTRDMIETSTHNKQIQTARYKQAVKYFNVAYKRFVAEIEKPVKVSSKRVRKAKGSKLLWQKSMRKKYKIKDKAGYE